MTDHPATPAQAEVLASVNAGRVTARIARSGNVLWFLNGYGTAKRPYERPLARGWIALPAASDKAGPVTLTAAGKRALTNVLAAELAGVTAERDALREALAEAEWEARSNAASLAGRDAADLQKGAL